MSWIISRVQYWAQLLLLPVYWLSFLIPRNKKIWLFGSTFGRRFADNPKYFFLFISQHREEFGVRPIWITHDNLIVEHLRANGYEAYHYHSLRGIWFALRGKVYLFDNYSKDINFWQSGGAIKINMWHGIPLKKIQADNLFDKVRHPHGLWERFCTFPRRLSDEKPNHYVLTTSKRMKPIFVSAFRTERVLTSGYPRNDFLASEEIDNLRTEEEEKAVQSVEEFHREHPDGKVVFYMPTFRESEKKFFEVVDLKQFRRFLEENRILFCVKLHPKSKLNREFADIAGGQLFVAGKDMDPYVFLKVSDVLVTDYSSIYFDCLLTEKPIVFFNYDLEEYLRDSREMYFEYADFTPGEKAAEMDELQSAILSALTGEQEYQDKFREVRERVTSYVFDRGEEIASRILARDILMILGKDG